MNMYIHFDFLLNRPWKYKYPFGEKIKYTLYDALAYL